MAAHTHEHLTPAMLRTLRSVANGDPGDLADFGLSALAFYAREKVLSALIARGLIEDAETITDAGRAAIAKATGSAQ